MKQKQVLIFSIALLLFGAWAILSMKGCMDRKKEVSDLRKAVAAWEDTTTHWKNKYGQVIASTTTAVVTSKDAKLFINMDSLAKVFATRAGNIKGYVKATTQGSVSIPAVGQPQIVYREKGEYDQPVPPVKYMTGSFASAYYTANVRLGDSPYLRLSSLDTITFVQKQAKKGRFFSRRYFTQVDVFNANPDVLVKSVESLLIEDYARQKKIVIYGQAGSLFLGGLDQSVLPYAGLGAEVSVKRFKLSGSWSRSLTGGAVSSFVDLKARFDLIRF